MMKYLILILFPFLLQAQSLLLLMGDEGIGEYPVTADLLHSYDERGMTISSWADQTGTNDFTQGTAGLQPILTANAINGYSGLLFDGVDNYMVYTADLVLAQPITIYFVAKMISWTDGDVLSRTMNIAGPLIAEGGGGTNVYMYAGSYEPIRTFGVGAYKIASCVFNGASSVFQVNDDVATGNTGAGGINGTIFLSANESGGANANMEFVALYIHSTAHDLATRTQIINWLNTKYGVY